MTNENKTCAYQKKLYAQLTTTFSPYIYNLLFTDSWPAFFIKMKEYLRITIEDYSENDYTYNYVLEKNVFIFTFNFKTPIINNNTMSLQINYEDKLDEEFLLVNKNFLVKVQPYCPPPDIYLSSNILFVLFIY